MNRVSFVSFAQWLGVALTPGQRVLATVAFDDVEPIDLSPSDRDIARQLFGDVERIPASVRHVLAVVAGARGGKTYLGALRGLHLALTVRLDSLAPGELAAGVLVAPDLRLAKQLHRYILGAVHRQPALKRIVVGQTQESLVLRRADGNHVELVCLPATEAGRSLRGRTLAFAVFDESAFFYSEGYAVTDSELFKAVAPRVVADGQVLLLSTPWGEMGLLWELWRDNFGKPTAALVAWAPTLLLRDDEHTRAVIERERTRDPRNAEREFDARFASTDENLLDGSDIDAAIDRGRFSTQRQQGTRYGCAVDLATRHDFSVVVVGHRELMRRDGAPPVDCLVIDVARHWAPSRVGKLLKQRVEPDELERELADAATHFRTGVVADAWSFDFFESRMRQRGIAVEQASMAPADQARRASLLATYFRQGRVRLPEGNPELIRQLKSLRVTRTAGGHLRFAAANRKGQHDDFPKALMLLVERVQSLPASGGTIGSTWGSDGRRHWYGIDAHGNREPCLPPMGSRDWIDLAYRCQRDGVHIASLDAWLAEPANQEALERQIERRNTSERVFRALARR